MQNGVHRGKKPETEAKSKTGNGKETSHTEQSTNLSENISEATMSLSKTCRIL